MLLLHRRGDPHELPRSPGGALRGSARSRGGHDLALVDEGADLGGELLRVAPDLTTLSISELMLAATAGLLAMPGGMA